MADIKRTSQAVWAGDLRGGNGSITTASRVLDSESYSYATRFERKPGTNPEELIAAANAACYSMALANTLAKKGYDPARILTRATCTLTPLDQGGVEISRMHLKVQGEVPGIDQETFRKLALEADENCPVSNALRPGMEHGLEAVLVESLSTERIR
jgi:osmotically inducible protein OsmC